MLSDVNARKMTIKKSVIVIITGLLCLAVLISMLLFFGIGVWIGNFKYQFDLPAKKAYFIDYRGDGNDQLPYEIKGFSVEMTDFTCMVGDYKCRFNVEPDEVYIKSFEGKGEFVLPTKLLDREVYYMDDIENNSDITSVYIENNPDNKDWGVDVINCQNVEYVKFEEGTKIIWTKVCNSPKLKTITFPDGVEEIHGSFAGSGFEEVYFPKTVIYANGSYFIGSNFVNNHNKDKYYVVGDNVLLFYNGPVDERVIPEGIKYLYNYFFVDPEDKDIVEKMYFPESILGLNLDIPEKCEAYFGTNEIKGLDKCTIDGTVVAPEGSYMQKYCQDNGIKFRAMTEEEETIWREKTEAAATEITYQD